jgi:hypothetical protein
MRSNAGRGGEAGGEHSVCGSRSFITPQLDDVVNFARFVGRHVARKNDADDILFKRNNIPDFELGFI